MQRWTIVLFNVRRLVQRRRRGAGFVVGTGYETTGFRVVTKFSTQIVGLLRRRGKKTSTSGTGRTGVIHVKRRRIYGHGPVVHGTARGCVFARGFRVTVARSTRCVQACL